MERAVVATAVAIRVLVATAPSGGQSRLIKHTDLDKELSFYTGLLTADEEGEFWSAKLAAEKAGIANWNKAAALLRKAGWNVEDTTV